MRRILNWLQAKSSRQNPSIAPDQPSQAIGIERDEFARDDDEIEISFDPDVPGRIESQGEGKTVLMPDIYADPHAPTVPDLKILDQPMADVDESTGFNPYDTGVFQKKS
jgi:hypothetical protein